MTDLFKFASERFRFLAGWIEFPSSFAAGESQHRGGVFKFGCNQLAVLAFHFRAIHVSHRGIDRGEGSVQSVARDSLHRVAMG